MAETWQCFGYTIATCQATSHTDGTLHTRAAVVRAAQASRQHAVTQPKNAQSGNKIEPKMKGKGLLCLLRRVHETLLIMDAMLHIGRFMHCAAPCHLVLSTTFCMMCCSIGAQTAPPSQPIGHCTCTQPACRRQISRCIEYGLLSRPCNGCRADLSRSSGADHSPIVNMHRSSGPSNSPRGPHRTARWNVH